MQSNSKTNKTNEINGKSPKIIRQLRQMHMNDTQEQQIQRNFIIVKYLLKDSCYIYAAKSYITVVRHTHIE